MLLKLVFFAVIFADISASLIVTGKFDLVSLRFAPSFPRRLRRIEDLDAKIYRCVIKNLNITNTNITVDKVQGSHIKGYTNNDVQWLTIIQSNINFLPHDIDNFYNNIQYLDISHVGLLKLTQIDLSQFPNLRFLWAINNEIFELDLTTFDSNLKLISMDFSHNKLKYIDYRMMSRIISRNGLENINIKLEDNICVDSVDDFLKYGEFDTFECIREDEIFCKYNDMTFCKVELGTEFLGIEKTKVIGEFFIKGFEDREIKKVVVSKSNFTKIPAIFGEKFENLEVLEVHGIIWSLKPEVLENYRKLKKLNLAGNQLTFLKSDAFVFNPLLEYIDLSNNQLSSVGSSTFLLLKNLSTLILNNNPYIDVTLISRHEILNSVTLKEFSHDSDVVECRYSTSTFKYSGKLYYCEIIKPKYERSYTTKLEEFYGTKGQHSNSKTNVDVQALIAKYSTSTALDAKVSYHFPNLKTICITKSYLMYLHDINFHGLLKLQVVDFSHNMLSEVPSGIFDRNKNLIFVDLSYNKILKIYEIHGNFPNLKNFKILKNLPSFDNEFLAIDNSANEMFREVSTIYDIVINCQLIIPTPHSYESTIFNTTCKGKYVQQITELRPLIQVNSIHDTKSMTTLFLKSQVMYFLPTNLGDFFPILETFTAVGKIRKIFRQNFEKLSKLEELDLSQNDIEFIDDDQIFSENPNLKKLYLRENKIKKISQNVFVNLINFEGLVLDKNICALTSVFKIDVYSKNYKKDLVTEICGAKLPDNFGDG